MTEPVCDRCGGTTEGLSELLDPSCRRPPWRIVGHRCTPCWNESVAERQAARKAELDAEPRCEACGKGRRTWTIGQAGAQAKVCGLCKNRAKRAAPKGPLAGLALFAPVHYTRDDLLALARGKADQ